jgi:hypothetical protein
MKKAFLIMSAAILLSISGNCQWYNRRYGVNDINQLSREQLNHALIRARNGVTGGIVLSGLAAVGIGIGAFFIHDSKDPDKPGNIGPALAGMGLLIISIPLEITGLVVLGTNSHRAKSIKEVLKSTELKMGIVNYPCGNIFASSQGSLLPCLSITVRF